MVQNDPVHKMTAENIK